MPSEAYTLIHRALRRREQLTFSYQGLPRECCPVTLGYAADGREVFLAYQFAGSTSGKSKLPQWRCFYIGGISDLRSRPRAWLEGTSHTRRRTAFISSMWMSMCRKSLTRDLPLTFGAKTLRPPRR
jgi:hypothetical protein